MPSVREALKESIELLTPITDNPRREAEMLICHVLEWDRLKLFLNDQERMSSYQNDLFMALVKRREAGEPLQYLTGTQGFMGLDFEVAPGVLIPRNDTELLVETALKHLNSISENLKKQETDLNPPEVESLRVLDLGTGSGVVALSVAYYNKKVSAVGVDVSKAALDLAYKNRQVLGLEDRVKLIESDMFAYLEAAESESFDLIVSNPPYIPTEEIDMLQTEVRLHEPRLALDGGPDGLSPYRMLAGLALKPLVNGGRIALEIGHDQADRVKELLLDVGGWEKVECYRDLQGNDRVVTALKMMCEALGRGI